MQNADVVALQKTIDIINILTRFSLMNINSKKDI